MPALTNGKHEKFARFIAEGKTQIAAYEDAGYEPHFENASRLIRNDKVAARIAELQDAVAEHTTITVALVTESMVRIAKRAEEIESNYGPSALSVARASWMDAAKLNGLVVEKSEGSLNISVCRRLLELAED